jgi:hypothetical protein
VKDSSFVEVIAELWEADMGNWMNPDDRLWGRSKMRLLDPVNPDGKFTLSDEGTRVSVTYRVSPVEPT